MHIRNTWLLTLALSVLSFACAAPGDPEVVLR